MTATPEQIALLRGAACVPKTLTVGMGQAAADSYSEAELFSLVWASAIAATPPAYAEALAAVLDGYEAMQEATKVQPAFANGVIVEAAWLDGLEKDAARYRHVRAHNGYNLNNDADCGKWQLSRKQERGEGYYFYEDRLDAQIDADIAALAKLGEKA